MRKKKKLFFALISLVSLDFLTKSLTASLNPTQIFPFLSIRATENMGSAFGIFAHLPLYNGSMIFLSLLLFFPLSYFLFFEEKKILSDFSNSFLLFFLSGVLGNLLDRIFFGYVRDFIALEGFFIFNLADFYLTIAATVLLLSEIRNLVKANQKDKKK